MKKQINLLVALEDNDLSKKTIQDLISLRYEISTVHTGEDILFQIAKNYFDLLILDLQVLGNKDISIINKILDMNLFPEILIITEDVFQEMALQAVKIGAYDYLIRPFNNAELEIKIKKACEKKDLRYKTLLLQSQLERFNRYKDLIIASNKMESLWEKAKKIASSNSSIMLMGELGTGKGFLANYIHRNSPQRNGPFISVDTDGKPESMLEGELFGYEEGAFPYAPGSRIGLFELAGGGTIFLEEITNFSLTLQRKIISSIDSQSFFRLGGMRKIPLTVRILASTKKDIKTALADGTITEKFFEYLSRSQVTIPPLRERVEDIVVFAEHFLNIYGGEKARFAKGVMDLFNQYKWPGNLRELSLLIERLTLTCGPTISVKDLPSEFRNLLKMIDVKSRTTQDIKTPRSLQKLSVKDVEKAQILTALSKTNWHKGKAARLMGMSPSTFYRRLCIYGINRLPK